MGKSAQNTVRTRRAVNSNGPWNRATSGGVSGKSRTFIDVVSGRIGGARAATSLPHITDGRLSVCPKPPQALLTGARQSEPLARFCGDASSVQPPLSHARVSSRHATRSRPSRLPRPEASTRDQSRRSLQADATVSSDVSPPFSAAFTTTPLTRQQADASRATPPSPDEGESPSHGRPEQPSLEQFISTVQDEVTSQLRKFSVSCSDPLMAEAEELRVLWRQRCAEDVGREESVSCLAKRLRPTADINNNNSALADRMDADDCTAGSCSAPAIQRDDADSVRAVDEDLEEGDFVLQLCSSSQESQDALQMLRLYNDSEGTSWLESGDSGSSVSDPLRRLELPARSAASPGLWSPTPFWGSNGDLLDSLDAAAAAGGDICAADGSCSESFLSRYNPATKYAKLDTY